MGSQLEKRAQDKIKRRNPSAKTKDSRMIAEIGRNQGACQLLCLIRYICYSLLRPAAMMTISPDSSHSNAVEV